MKLLSVLTFFAILSVTAAHASPTVVARDAKGVTVNADLIRRYAELCKRYPAFGDKAGDGVFILDVDKFHLDTKHYVDYLSMVEMDKNATITRN